jgi:hypothetical protein
MVTHDISFLRRESKKEQTKKNKTMMTHKSNGDYAAKILLCLLNHE